MILRRKRKELQVDKLVIKIYGDRRSMGIAAAEHVAHLVNKLMERKSKVTMVFAAAPSQNEFLEELRKREDIDWDRIVAFHLDEYVGISSDAPQSFRRFLREKLFDYVKPSEVHYINGNAVDLEAECRRYAQLISSYGLDVACIGIGENGHIAFNDPHVANFEDPFLVKVVELDEVCRMQQIHDGMFSDISEVPRYAITLTIPAIMMAGHISCVVPSKRKAEAVKRALKGPISPECPASIIRTHDSAVLFLDKDAASKI